MISKEAAYSKISDLVDRFSEQFESYRKPDYNEALTRKDFIDPFFKALGWDMDNEQGYAEAYREVIHEDKIKVAKTTKASHYRCKIPVQNVQQVAVKECPLFYYLSVKFGCPIFYN